MPAWAGVMVLSWWLAAPAAHAACQRLRMDEHSTNRDVQVNGRTANVRFFTPVVVLNLNGGDPLTEGERGRYRAAAQQWARSLNETTNGQHQIGQVTFKVVESFEAPANAGSFDVSWLRGVHPANIPQSHVSGVRASYMSMFDEVVRARNGRVWQDASGGFVLYQSCPEGLEVEDVGGYDICVPPGGDPLLDTAEDWGRVLGHEMFHLWYCLRDEYIYPDCETAAGFPESNDNVTYTHTCLDHEGLSSNMASSSRPHWCSNDTHLLAQCYWENRPFDKDDPRPMTPAKKDATELIADGHCDHPVVNLNHSCVENTPIWEQLVADKALWPELVEVYGVGQPYAQPAPEVTFPVHPDWPEFCVFEDETQGAVFDDVVVVVDGSGSMKYRSHTLAQTAFREALDAGIAVYNASINQRKSGILAFNTGFERLRSYAPVTGSVTAADLAIPASMPNNKTDLCGAMVEAKSMITDGGSDTVSMILLTDGLPTAGDCLEDDFQKVIDQARGLCQDGTILHTVAFGDADFLLLREMSRACGGAQYVVVDTAETITDDNDPPETALRAPPTLVKTALMRTAANARSRVELGFSDGLVRSFQTDTFAVPPGSHGLEVTLVGDSFESPGPGDGAPPQCRFADLELELLDPSGVARGVSPVDVADELTYRVKRLRVSGPVLPGFWRANVRTTGSLWPCRADNPSYTDYVPRFALTASVYSQDVRGSLELSADRIAGNQVLTVEAAIEAGGPWRLTNITATGVVTHEDQPKVTLAMNDAGNAGDRVAGDGIYTGRFNDACVAHDAALDSGAYRVHVKLNALQGSSVAVATITNDAQPFAEPGTGPSIGATLSLERAFLVDDCLAEAARSHCPGGAEPSPADACMPVTAMPGVTGVDCTLELGSERQDLVIHTTGFPTGSEGVQVNLGTGIYVSNVRASYDRELDEGEVRFDARVDPRAPLGFRTATVGWFGATVQAEADCFEVGCGAVDLDPPRIEAPDAVIETCRPQDQLVQLEPPVVTDACSPGQPISVDGFLLSVNGEPVSGVVSIDPQNPEVVLPPGQAEIVWFAIDIHGNSDFVVQRVHVVVDVTDDCCPAGSLVVLGTAGPDALTRYGSASVCMLGFSGADALTTWSGNDFLAGAEGGDVLYANGGNDVCLGGDAADNINAGSGQNSIYGGDGSDNLTGGSSADLVYAGKDRDNVYTNGGADTVIPGPGADLVYLGTGNDVLIVYDVCEYQTGETLTGDGGTDTLITPIPLVEVQALGVSVSGFEIIVEDDSMQHLSECFGS